jgi:hypothetical protein
MIPMGKGKTVYGEISDILACWAQPPK